MKKYEPAITVVFLTLLFAVLAFLVARAVMREPDLLIPWMECKTIEPNEPEYDTIYTDESGNDIIICDANNAAVGYFTIDTDPNEPNNLFGYANLARFEPYTTMTISCEDGNDVIIDYSGDKVVVTGASEEGAKIFFEGMLKPLMDAYLESKNGNDE